MYVGAVGVMPVRQRVLPALDGAVEVAAVALTTTVAVSMSPLLSVTVNVTVNVPAPLGARIVTVEEFAPETIVPAWLLVQAYELALKDELHAAALPAALNVKF